jgi:hypothetical protein
MLGAGLKEIMKEKFISDLCEVEDREEEVGKSEPPAAFLSALEDINTVSK